MMDLLTEEVRFVFESTIEVVVQPSAPGSRTYQEAGTAKLTEIRVGDPTDDPAVLQRVYTPDDPPPIEERPAIVVAANCALVALPNWASLAEVVAERS